MVVEFIFTKNIYPKNLMFSSLFSHTHTRVSPTNKNQS